MEAKRERALAVAVGASIAQARTAKGLTQEQVAEALGIGMEAVSRMERGVVMPSLARLAEFSELFDCPMERFVKRGSDRSSDLASLLHDLIAPLKKADRLFVVELVEQTSKYLRTKKDL